MLNYLNLAVDKLSNYIVQTTHCFSLTGPNLIRDTVNWRVNDTVQDVCPRSLISNVHMVLNLV